MKIHPSSFILHLSRGFTLIELTVVMAIIGILTALIGSNFMSAQMKGRDSRRKSDLNNLSKALELYFNDHGNYPPSSSNKVAGCGSDSQTACEWGASFIDQYGTVYMEVLPDETRANYDYVYKASADGLKYQLFARIENENDSAVDQDGDGNPDEYSVSCGGSNCNFAVTSPNTTGDESL